MPGKIHFHVRVKSSNVGKNSLNMSLGKCFPPSYIGGQGTKSGWKNLHTYISPSSMHISENTVAKYAIFSEYLSLMQPTHLQNRRIFC